MVIENNNQKEQQDIVKQENGNENKENSIESVLQKKFQDPTKESFFMDIFEDSQVKNTYTQQSIINFIQGDEKISKFYRTNQTTEHNEKVKKTTEMIDIFEKNNGNTTIISVSNTLENSAVQKENSAVQKENSAVQKENRVVQKENRVVQNKNSAVQKENRVVQNKNRVKIEENRVKIKENRVKIEENRVEIKKIIKFNAEQINKQAKLTKESYDKLDTKYKISDKQINEIKSDKNNKKFIDQLTQNIEGTDIKVDDYLKFYLTTKNNKEELKNTEFMTNYETLEKMIYTTNMGELKDPKNTDYVVKHNESLKKYTEESKSLDNISAPILPETKDFDEEFSTYVKLIPDKDIKERIIKNEEIIKTYNAVKVDEEEARDEKARAAYEEYMTAIEEVKETLPNKIQTMVKQRVMGSCISGLAKYFDTTTMNKENFADDFDINTQEGFSIEKGKRTDDEEGDDILYINGNIKGNNIGFYYNLDNPDARLQSDDFLNLDNKTDTFTFGAGSGGKTDLGVKLPTLGLLADQAQTVVDENFADDIKDASNLEDFETTLKEKISNQLLKNYGQEALVKTRVERDIEKNITTQTLNDMFIPDAVLEAMNQNKSIDKTTEKRPRKLMEIRDTSTENMRSDELRRFRSLMERLDPLITDRAEKPQGNLSRRRQNMLEGMEEDRGAESYSDDRGKSTLKFFKKFSDDGEMDLQNLEVFITGLEKKESVTDNIGKYSPDFQTAEDQEDADKLIENIV